MKVQMQREPQPEGSRTRVKEKIGRSIHTIKKQYVDKGPAGEGYLRPFVDFIRTDATKPPNINNLQSIRKKMLSENGQNVPANKCTMWGGRDVNETLVVMEMRLLNILENQMYVFKISAFFATVTFPVRGTISKQLTTL